MELDTTITLRCVPFWIVLFAKLSTCLVLEDTNVTLAIPGKALTWDDAAQYCVDNGGHLATVTDDYVQTLLGTLMQIKGTAFLWIGARERDSGWTWADDIYSGKGFNAWAPGHPVNKDTEPACAFLRGSEDYVWVDHPCAMQHAFVCEMDISSSICKENGAFLFTSKQGGSCLILHQRAPRSWYKAREHCVESGGRLAVFHNETIYKKFKGHLGEKLQVSGDYWLGLRDSSLQWQDERDVIRTYWEGGQPSRAGRCVQMEKFGQGVYLWANHDCNRAQSFVCQLKQQVPATKVEQSFPVAKDNIGKRWPCQNMDKGPLHFSFEKFINSIILQGVAFILGILVMFIPLIFMCRRKPRRQMGNASMKPHPPTRSSPDYATPATTANISRSAFPPSRVQVEANISDPLPPPPAMEQNIYSIQPVENPTSHYPYHQQNGQRPQTYELPGGYSHGFANGGFNHSTNSLQARPNALNLLHQQMLNVVNSSPTAAIPVALPKVPKMNELELPSNRSSGSYEGRASPSTPGAAAEETLYRVRDHESADNQKSEVTSSAVSSEARSIESHSLYSIAEV